MKTVGGADEVKVSFPLADGELRSVVFGEAFIIGREEDCDLFLADDVVSKRHIKVYRREDGWWVRDLGSMNGTFLNGERVQHALISRDSEIQVAVDGPILRVELLGVKAGVVDMSEGPTVTDADLRQGAKAQPAPEPAVRRKHRSKTVPAAMREHRPETVPDLSSEPASEVSTPAPLPAVAEGAPPGTVTQVLERYADDTSPREAGPHTLIMRRAFARLKRQESKRYHIIIAAGLVLLLVVGVVMIFQQMKLDKLTALGVDIFYDMKAMEVQVEQMLEAVVQTGDSAQLEKLAAKRKQLEAMKARYDNYVEETGLLDRYADEKDRLIFRIARLFGECELALPEEFLAEVKNYIGKWKSTPRLRKAIARVEKDSQAAKVYQIMVGDHLPPQFMYLGLQESDFKPQAVGPKTRFGIAKGIWQFIPTTAVQYGLRTGPLVELPVYDPRDERFDFDKATQAAAKYLRYIYNTEAQASGLLVIASYNWGHNNIRRRIRKMPDNPRERNFWKLLARHDIPRETYDYVFYIVAAAVIGENPELFGFSFANPLDGAQNPTPPTAMDEQG